MQWLRENSTGLTIGIAVAAIIVVGFLGIMRSDSDGIEEGKPYDLAYTYKTAIKGNPIEGRVFDFADRNLPRTSILVPVQDARGIPLVRENGNMKPGTVRKMHVVVPTAKIEGVTYPGYEYVEWQFRFGVREPQSVVPTVIPKK